MTTSVSEQLGVVFVHGDEQTRVAVSECLAAVSDLRVDAVPDIESTVERIGAGSVDCVITAETLPDGDAFDLLAAVRECHGGVAVVLSPSEGSETLAADAIAAGIDGYRPHDGIESTCDDLASDVVAAVGRRHEQTGMLDRMTDAFFALDTSFRLTYVNERARAVLSEAFGEDLTADELRGKHLRDDIPDVGEAGFFERYRQAMAERDPVSFEEYYPRLSAWFDVRAYPTEGGLAVYFRDVTDQHEYEQRLEHREEVLTEMYRIIADADRSFAQKVQSLFTIGREELGTKYATLSTAGGQTYIFEHVQAPDGDDAITPGDEVPLSATSCERAIVTEETLVIEDMADQTPDIAQRAGNVEMGLSCYLGVPVADDAGISGTFCFYGTEPRAEPFSQWQVTLVELMGSWVSYERGRQYRKAELTRERNRLEEFASVVSHDLRNPMNVARSRLELASDECDSDHLDTVDGALDRMDALIDDVLASARLGQQVVDPEPTDAGDVARRAWQAVSLADAELTVEAVPTLAADPTRLQRLFENLFRNAVEHGPSDAHVTVGPLDGTVGFYVADDGPGIPAEEREAVFEHGHTTEADGTGFGLSIVAEIAEAHGASVSISDSESGGARFEIRGFESA
jgi:GAF domain-containing protein